MSGSAPPAPSSTRWGHPRRSWSAQAVTPPEGKHDDRRAQPSCRTPGRDLHLAGVQPPPDGPGPPHGDRTGRPVRRHPRRAEGLADRPDHPERPLAVPAAALRRTDVPVQSAQKGAHVTGTADRRGYHSAVHQAAEARGAASVLNDPQRPAPSIVARLLTWRPRVIWELGPPEKKKECMRRGCS